MENCKICDKFFNFENKKEDVFIRDVARTIVGIFHTQKWKKKIMFGHDENLKSDYVFSVLCSVLLKHGFEIENIENCSSPAIAYLTKKYAIKFSVFVCNDKKNNSFAFKFFNCNGEKINEKFYENFKKFNKKHIKNTKNSINSINFCKNLKNEYVLFLKSQIKNSENFLFSTPSKFVKQTVENLYKKKAKFVREKDILNSISNSFPMLKNKCKKENCFGFFLNSDASVVKCILPTGKLVETEKIVKLFKQIFLKNQTDSDKEIYCTKTDEIYMKKFSNCPDGILNLICLLNIFGLSNFSCHLN